MPRHSCPPPGAITLSCTEDFLSLVPYLMGYSPHEQLVVVVVDAGRIGVTIGVGLQHLDDPARARAMVMSSVDRFGEPAVLLAVWTTDESSGAEAAHRVSAWFAAPQLLDVVLVGPSRWHSITDPGRGGSTTALAVSPVAAEAVLAGLRTAGSRTEVVSCLGAPGDDPALVQRHRAAEAAWLAELPQACDRRAVDLQEAALDGHWSPADLTDLAVLTLDPAVVDRLWLCLDQRRAPAALALWLAVVAQAPHGWRRGALAMAGFTAWLAGNGVLHVAAVEQLAALGPVDDTLMALEALNREAVPPSMWARVRAREVLGAPL